MTHHFLRATQLTPSEIQFRERHKAARARIKAAGDAYARRLTEVIAQQQHEIKVAEEAAAPKLAPPSIPKETFQHIDKIKVIQRLTCEAFGLTMPELLSDRRERRLVMARQIAMHLCKRLTSISFPKVGRRFGRDHTTVLYACERIEGILALRPPERAASWTAKDCQEVRDKVAELLKAYDETFATEEQP